MTQNSWAQTHNLRYLELNIIINFKLTELIEFAGTGRFFHAVYLVNGQLYPRTLRLTDS